MSEKNFKVFKSSAGSGKTFALVKEYLKFCLRSEDRYYFSRILAITFTNKASGEMKDRIITTLKKAIDEKAVRDEPLLYESWQELGIEMDQFLFRSKQLLSALLHNYGDLSVSTIDKFMLKVIRSFSRDLKLPLNFEVDMQQERLLERVISRLLSDIGQDVIADKLVFDYARWRIDDGKSWRLEDDLLKTASSLYMEGADEYLGRIKELSYSDYQELIASYKKQNQEFRSKVKSEALKVVEVMKANGLAVSDFHYGEVGSYGKYMLKTSQGDFDKPKPRVISAIDNERFHGSTSPDKIEIIKSHSSFFVEVGRRIQSFFDEEWQVYNERILFLTYLPAQALFGKIDLELSKLKTEENLINISDFNKLISEIVLKDYIPFIYERIGERYQHIMVDEFQDTSIKQFQNLLPLFDESLSKGNENMIVGDAKQSIYRFRGAEVEQFSQMPNIELAAFKKELNAERLSSLQRNYQPVPLNMNWRSSTEIIQFNNDFFDHLYERGNISERNKLIFEEHKQLIPEHADKGGYIEIRKMQGKVVAEREMANKEAVLEIIRSLKSKGFKYADMAILCMKKDQLSSLARYLSAKGIPLVSDEALKLKHSASVNFLIDLLSWRLESNNDEAAIQIFNYLHANNWIGGDKVEIEMNYLSKKGKGLSQLLHDNGIPIPQKPNSHENLMQWFEKQIRAFDLHTSYDPYLQFLQEYVFEFVQKQKGSTSDFFLLWELDQEKLSIEMNSMGDAVQMMTIHKSKGLEFPAVILPFAEYSVSTKPKLLWVEGLADPAESLGLEVGLLSATSKLQETSYSDDYEYEMIKREGDLLNSIYVAFTRAVNSLYILSAEASGNGETVSLPALLSDFVEGMDSKDDCFYRGEHNDYISKNEKSDAQELKMEKYHSSSWNKKVSLSLEMKTQWKEEDHELDSRSYGTLLHEILAAIHKKDDMPKVVEAFYLSGRIDLQMKEEIALQLKQLFDKEELQQFFNSQHKSSNERSFLSSSSEVLRPDRLVESEEELMILDYKSGEKREKDVKQLQNYCQELSSISKKKVSAYLLYLSNQELVKVA